jgi:hypothetical protein
MKLTLREAKWVARLRGIAPDDLLYPWIGKLARGEQVYRLLGREEIYTAYLDIDIVFLMENVIWSTHEVEVL